MRPILLLCALVAALVSFPAHVSTSDDDPRRTELSPHAYGRRDHTPQANGRNSLTPPKKRQDRPRPSPKPPTRKRDGEDNPPSRPKPSPAYVRRPTPSPTYVRSPNGGPPRAKPSGVYSDYLLRRSSAAAEKGRDDRGRSEVRSLEEQTVVWSDGPKSGPSWDLEDRCPAPLSACPVRGVPDADVYECVDLLSDLDSCGGCATDDIACVFLPPFFSFLPSLCIRFIFFAFNKEAELQSLSVVTRRHLALIAVQSPMHAASNVCLDFARCARAWKGTWLRHRATYVCASKSVVRIPA
jgi:hypothetical protein